MPVTKLTISLPEELAEAIRVEAEAAGSSVSGFIANELRRTHLLQERRTAIAEYEAEHGAITEAEREQVRDWLRRGGVEWPPSRSTPAR